MQLHFPFYVTPLHRAPWHKLHVVNEDAEVCYEGSCFTLCNVIVTSQKISFQHNFSLSP